MPGGSRGLSKVLAAAAALGTLGPVAALAYGQGVGPATFSALRAAIGATIFGATLLAHLQPSVSLTRLAPRQRTTLAAAAVINGATNLILFFAFGAMAVGLVMAVYYLYPVFVALLSAVLGRERLTRVRILALGIACAGLVLVLGSQLQPGAHATLEGVALAAAAALCQAIYLVAIRGGFDAVPGVQATTVVLLGGVAVSGLAAILLEGGGGAGEWLVSPNAWVALACAGTVGALPKVWIMGGVRAIGSTRAALALLTEPVVAVVVAAIVLGQRLAVGELVGGAAILLAVTLVRRTDGAAPERVLATPGGLEERVPRSDPDPC